MQNNWWRALTAGLLAGAVALTTGPATAGEPYREVVAEETRRAQVSGSSVHLRVANLNTFFDVSDAQFLAQLRMLQAEKPHVMMLQEVAPRTRMLRSWADRHDYRIYQPGGTRDLWKNESVVLWKDNGRFRVLGYETRVGSRPLHRANGGYISTRYLVTVRVRDRVSGQRLAFTSTHATPEVYVKDRYGVHPTWGTETLAGFRRHMVAIRDLVAANGSALTVLAGDLNSPARHEAKWYGFQTHRFGTKLRSNHQAFGPIGTLSTHRGAAIDYLYVTKSRRVDFARERFIDTYSDHHAMIFDLRLARS